MARPAIRAEGLSKRYRIPAPVTGQESRLHRALSMWQKADWIDAVHDVSFLIEEGEAIGLIGRNGAGKSTLLKLLSRVTRPTTGYADLYGRVGALLEVGTGFHPELTGRENAFLSGAILGLSKREIAVRFDEIVAFAEIAPFIDMPVKHYSSGMYARLGFSVAAFLKPAILIVDEVLAVGDIAFQAKCLAYMKRLSADGTTIIFVSHNLLSISDFCGRALLMDGGRLVFDGTVNEAIAHYRASLSPRVSPDTSSNPALGQLTINGSATDGVREVRPNDPLRVDVALARAIDSVPTQVILNLVVETPDGQALIHLRSDAGGSDLALEPGTNEVSVTIDALPLAPGSYWLWLRAVALDPNAPMIWDTERCLLLVLGNQAQVSPVLPRHTFYVRPTHQPSSAPAPLGR